MNFHVSIHLRFGNEPFAAHLAAVRFFSRVNGNVIIQSLPRAKRFVTRAALVGSIVGVRSPVYVNAVCRFKRLPAYVTHVSSFSRVRSPVIVSSVFCGKQSTANITAKSFDFIVNFSHVTRYVLFLNETLSANVTSVRPIAQMIFHVPRESLLSDKSFIAQTARDSTFGVHFILDFTSVQA